MHGRGTEDTVPRHRLRAQQVHNLETLQRGGLSTLFLKVHISRGVLGEQAFTSP